MTMDMNRRSFMKRSAGIAALALGAGTPFLNSRAAYAQVTALEKQQLRTIGLSTTVQERLLAEFKAASGVGTTSGTAATFPDAQTKILSGSKDFDCWEVIAERLPA
ncbi:twin-arginine translocation signal domain-containing protein, partial [Pseudoxanthobacter sp.]|uniref:twin-arginine translocation signal domain-containing protein n=1 Tax=Pseudoxanthobacter sp. TaxID=1925742 RepID=UPI002FE0CDE9